MRNIVTLVVGLAWPLIVITVAILFRMQLTSIVDALVARIKSPATIKLGSVELQGITVFRKNDLADGRDIEATTPPDEPAETCGERPASGEDFKRRGKIRTDSRFIRLVHKVGYSGRPRPLPSSGALLP
jgi:hypothetical protein